MKKTLSVIYMDGKSHSIHGFGTQENLISLANDTITENHSGFKSKDPDGNMVFDGSDYIYRWDILNNNRPNEIWYTNRPDYRQTQQFPSNKELDAVPIPAAPLTNEELTEAIADLMCEVSMMQLNI